MDALFAGDPDSIGPSEVAARLGVTSRTVYSWLRDGLIPAYKVGSSWVVITEELKDVIRAGRNGAPTDQTATSE